MNLSQCECVGATVTRVELRRALYQGVVYKKADRNRILGVIPHTKIPHSIGIAAAERKPVAVFFSHCAVLQATPKNHTDSSSSLKTQRPLGAKSSQACGSALACSARLATAGPNARSEVHRG